MKIENPEIFMFVFVQNGENGKNRFDMYHAELNPDLAKVRKVDSDYFSSQIRQCWMRFCRRAVG
jgi:hypothetical protein